MVRTLEKQTKDTRMDVDLLKDQERRRGLKSVITRMGRRSRCLSIRIPQVLEKWTDTQPEDFSSLAVLGLLLLQKSGVDAAKENVWGKVSLAPVVQETKETSDTGKGLEITKQKMTTLVRSGMSAKRMAGFFGYDVRTIYRKLEEYGLEVSKNE